MPDRAAGEYDYLRRAVRRPPRRRSTATSCAAATRSAGRRRAAGSISVGDQARPRRPLLDLGARASCAPGDAARRDEPAGHVHVDARRPRRRARRRHRRRVGHHAADGARRTRCSRGPRRRGSRSSTRTARRLDVMFLDELADLKDRYPTRLALHHVLSREQRSAPLLSGRIDEREAAHASSTRSSSPRPSTSGSSAARSSSCSSAATPSTSVGVDRATRPLRAVHDGRRRARSSRRRRAPGRRAPRRADVHASSSRSTGSPATVESPVQRERVDPQRRAAGAPRRAVRLRGRRVRHLPRAAASRARSQMTENYALEPDELERGYVLTCQSHPDDRPVVVDYDV